MNLWSKNCRSTVELYKGKRDCHINHDCMPVLIVRHAVHYYNRCCEIDSDWSNLISSDEFYEWQLNSLHVFRKNYDRRSVIQSTMVINWHLCAMYKHVKKSSGTYQTVCHLSHSWCITIWKSYKSKAPRSTKRSTPSSRTFFFFFFRIHQKLLWVSLPAWWRQHTISTRW